ncbi:hypothetical protein GGF31_007366 [Allomyces arbusculus]|nr:hypothetical protein GGF31_007366 [Allomyces arbusculus]
MNNKLPLLRGSYPAREAFCYQQLGKFVAELHEIVQRAPDATTVATDSVAALSVIEPIAAASAVVSESATFATAPAFEDPRSTRAVSKDHGAQAPKDKIERRMTTIVGTMQALLVSPAGVFLSGNVKATVFDTFKSLWKSVRPGRGKLASERFMLNTRDHGPGHWVMVVAESESPLPKLTRK